MFTSVDLAAIRIIASRFLVPVYWLLALAEVESAGRAFWSVDGRSRPAINLEGHYMYKRLRGDTLHRALLRGLVHKSAGKTKVPNSYSARYDMLDEWLALDRQAALESISIGVGQVMGAHWKRLGFTSVEAMWEMANSSLAGQVEIMCRFITTDPKLKDAINRQKFSLVAEIYNGPNYKVNAYHTKIAAAVSKWMRHATASQISAPTSHAKEVSNIKSLGFDTVEAFQRDKGISADGIVGPITRDKIEEAVQAKTQAVNVGAAAATGVVATGAITVAITEVTDAAKHVDTLVVYLKMLGGYGPQIASVGILSLVVGVTAFSFWKSAQNAKV